MLYVFIVILHVNITTCMLHVDINKSYYSSLSNDILTVDDNMKYHECVWHNTENPTVSWTLNIVIVKGPRTFNMMLCHKYGCSKYLVVLLLETGALTLNLSRSHWLHTNLNCNISMTITENKNSYKNIIFALST